jgi:POT family proton-dependent oligopeptide transporter
MNGTAGKTNAKRAFQRKGAGSKGFQIPGDSGKVQSMTRPGPPHTQAIPLPIEDTAFFGHPKGLGYLSFSEAWERFSYYGMQTLLVLYMVHQLLLPGHIEHVAGFAMLRGFLERVSGPLSVQALASAVFGLYAGAVYVTPILGGLLADRVLGRTTTVIIGALLMAAGHFLMAFAWPFLLALLCLVLGNGCFKGNIASQVGGLYAHDDLRRSDAFQIYYLAINAGVIITPLVCGTLGELVGWHWGFAAAGVGMLLGLAIYLAGRRYYPPEAPRQAGVKKTALSLKPAEIRTIIVLVLLLPVLAISACSNQQIFNAYLVWAERHVDLRAFGHVIPTTWLITLDSIVSVSTLAGSIVFWQAWAKKRREPDELTKLVLGCAVTAVGSLCLVAAAAGSAATGEKAPIYWLFGFHLLNDIGFANVFPVALALYSRAAPPQLASTIIGIYYLSLAGANLFVGWLGGLLEKMPATNFWLLHAGLVAAAGLIFFLVRPLFRDALA